MEYHTHTLAIRFMQTVHMVSSVKKVRHNCHTHPNEWLMAEHQYQAFRLGVCELGPVQTLLTMSLRVHQRFTEVHVHQSFIHL